MEWSDKGIILSVRSHGETSVIAELLTRTQGRHLGLVRGGQSRRLRPILQPGNLVNVTWRARLAEHLGFLNLELKHGFAGETMGSPQSLAGLMSLCTFARLLAEREPHPALFEVSLFVLEYMGDEDVWPALYVRWELALLDDLGFGLDLHCCAATGSQEDLIYVSPKSRRAVSRTAGKPYSSKLLRLPRFLRKDRSGQAEPGEVSDGLQLTGYFLERDVLTPRNLKMPEPRIRLAAYVS